MKFSTVFGSLGLAAKVIAQSSPGAPYDIGSYLPVVFNNSVQVQPGMLFQPTQVAVAPSWGSVQSINSMNQPFVVIMIDINIVLNSSQPNNQSEFLHVLQPNLYVNSSNGNLTFNATGSNSSSVVGASYWSPTPPSNSVHHYNIMLFRQPVNFTVPTAFARFNQPKDELARAEFNLTQFAGASGLGQPLAANYFRVLNGTMAQSSAASTQTATSGVAFPSGFSFSNSATAIGTTLSGTANPSGSSASSSATGSAPTPSSSTSSGSESNDLGQSFVKAVCIAVAATLPWIW